MDCLAKTLSLRCADEVTSVGAINIGLLIAVIGCFVGLAGWLSGQDKKILGDGEWKGTVNTKLDEIKSSVSGTNSELGRISETIKLHDKGINGVSALEKVDTGITYAQSVAEAIAPFLLAVAGPVINKVLSITQKAAQHVEATYKAALSTNSGATDTRRTEAASLIKSALALDGMADSAEVDKLIDVVIPLLVLALPKTHEAAAKAA